MRSILPHPRSGSLLIGMRQGSQSRSRTTAPAFLPTSLAGSEILTSPPRPTGGPNRKKGPGLALASSSPKLFLSAQGQLSRLRIVSRQPLERSSQSRGTGQRLSVKPRLYPPAMSAPRPSPLRQTCGGIELNQRQKAGKNPLFFRKNPLFS